MKEFKSIATMLEEQKINAKKKRENVKRLRDEASYEERLLSYARRDENEEIIANVREHFTAEQIANKEYLQNATQYELKDITKELPQISAEAVIRNSLYVPGVKSRNSDLKNTRYHEDDKIGIIEHKLNWFGNKLDEVDARLDMLEGKPPYPYSKSFDA